MYISYRQIVREAEKAFEKSMRSMSDELDTRVSSASWNEDTIQSNERNLAITMNIYGTTGDFREDIGLILNNNFTDYAANLYKISSSSNSHELVKATEDYVYMVEQKESHIDSSLNNYHQIYACPVDEIREAYEFELEHRHRDGSYQRTSGFVSMDSFYINYETGVFKPKQVSLYTYAVYENDNSNLPKPKLENTIIYEPTDIEGFEYIDCSDPAFHNKYTLQHHGFYGPYFACSQAGGSADTVLQQAISENKDNFNSLVSFGSKRGNHGLVLEFSYLYSFSVVEANPSIYIEPGTTTELSSEELSSNKLPSVCTYVACTAATMDLWKLYGRKIILYYLCMISVSLLASILLAKRTYAKYKIQYQMLDYRKALTDAMAHDLKSPLMAISGYAENLKENIYTDNKEIYADKILTNIEDMNRIITDILELSKAETDSTNVALENISLRTLFEDVFFTYEEEMDNRGISYEIQGDSSAKANPRVMKRVIDNLINNAITYGLDDSVITVSIEKYGFTIKNAFDEREIDEAFTKNINELTKPFVKGNKSRTNHKGSGLGLTIVKELLNAQEYKLGIILCDSNFIIKVWS